MDVWTVLWSDGYFNFSRYLAATISAVPFTVIYACLLYTSIYTLGASGFEAVGFQDGNELFKALQNETPRLITLDIMLPGEDGISILKKLRSNSATANIPIILCTAKGTEYDKVIGLDFGADDYLVKPFGMMEMISRIKALLRRTSPQKEVRKLHVGEPVSYTHLPIRSRT